MSRFYILLWLRWAVRLTISSLFFAALFSSFVTLYIYVLRGLPELSFEITGALFDIFRFWFPLFWSLTILLALFRGLKYIFNSCINGYELKLLTCEGSDVIEVIGYGDLVKVWRKWLMLLIWLVGSAMILALIYTNLFTSYDGVFEWFSIYWLYGFILLSGYFSFIILSSKCKKIKIVTC
ncbi:hypothetical protein [Sulfurimonas sp.]|jgi:hypothetical protein|uniref:hypothetical protein n=1 Tax=Sulfurimonas sp. TaxID=2022749 RepID=UPI00260014EC|nr:hypothetical protein [Sulfurimonas sp.]MCK9473162.1 hypothetical protein [Sulfurimonas sp.]MDD3506153.1 hypothetical protein [Sulfurimonas sp.]